MVTAKPKVQPKSKPTVTPTKLKLSSQNGTAAAATQSPTVVKSLPHSGRPATAPANNLAKSPARSPKDDQAVDIQIGYGSKASARYPRRYTKEKAKQYESIAFQTIEHLSENSSLTSKTLVLAHVPFSRWFVNDLGRSLQHNTRLQNLELTDCELTCNEIQILCGFLRSNVGLKNLDLSFNKIRSVGCRHISGLLETGPNSSMTNHSKNAPLRLRLQHLNLSRNHCGPIGCKHLGGALVANKYLRSLSLSANSLDSWAAGWLAYALTHNAVLEVLDVTENPIGRPGVTELRQMGSKTEREIEMVESAVVEGLTEKKAEACQALLNLESVGEAIAVLEKKIENAKNSKNVETDLVDDLIRSAKEEFPGENFSGSASGTSSAVAIESQPGEIQTTEPSIKVTDDVLFISDDINAKGLNGRPSCRNIKLPEGGFDIDLEEENTNNLKEESKTTIMPISSTVRPKKAAARVIRVTDFRSAPLFPYYTDGGENTFGLSAQEIYAKKHRLECTGSPGKKPQTAANSAADKSANGLTTLKQLMTAQKSKRLQKPIQLNGLSVMGEAVNGGGASSSTPTKIAPILKIPEETAVTQSLSPMKNTPNTVGSKRHFKSFPVPDDHSPSRFKLKYRHRYSPELDAFGSCTHAVSNPVSTVPHSNNLDRSPSPDTSPEEWDPLTALKMLTSKKIEKVGKRQKKKAQAQAGPKQRKPPGETASEKNFSAHPLRTKGLAKTPDNFVKADKNQHAHLRLNLESNLRSRSPSSGGGRSPEDAVEDFKHLQPTLSGIWLNLPEFSEDYGPYSEGGSEISDSENTTNNFLAHLPTYYDSTLDDLKLLTTLFNNLKALPGSVSEDVLAQQDRLVAELQKAAMEVESGRRRGDNGRNLNCYLGGGPLVYTENDTNNTGGLGADSGESTTVTGPMNQNQKGGPTTVTTANGAPDPALVPHLNLNPKAKAHADSAKKNTGLQKLSNSQAQVLPITLGPAIETLTNSGRSNIQMANNLVFNPNIQLDVSSDIISGLNPNLKTWVNPINEKTGILPLAMQPKNLRPGAQEALLKRRVSEKNMGIVQRISSRVAAKNAVLGAATNAVLGGDSGYAYRGNITQIGGTTKKMTHQAMMVVENQNSFVADSDAPATTMLTTNNYTPRDDSRWQIQVHPADQDSDKNLDVTEKKNSFNFQKTVVDALVRANLMPPFTQFHYNAFRSRDFMSDILLARENEKDRLKAAQLAQEEEDRLALKKSRQAIRALNQMQALAQHPTSTLRNSTTSLNCMNNLDPDAHHGVLNHMLNSHNLIHGGEIHIREEDGAGLYTTSLTNAVAKVIQMRRETGARYSNCSQSKGPVGLLGEELEVLRKISLTRPEVSENATPREDGESLVLNEVGPGPEGNPRSESDVISASNSTVPRVTIISAEEAESEAHQCSKNGDQVSTISKGPTVTVLNPVRVSEKILNNINNNSKADAASSSNPLYDDDFEKTTLSLMNTMNSNTVPEESDNVSVNHNVKKKSDLTSLSMPHELSCTAGWSRTGLNKSGHNSAVDDTNLNDSTLFGGHSQSRSVLAGAREESQSQFNQASPLDSQVSSQKFSCNLKFKEKKKKKKFNPRQLPPMSTNPPQVEDPPVNFNTTIANSVSSAQSQDSVDAALDMLSDGDSEAVSEALDHLSLTHQDTVEPFDPQISGGDRDLNQSGSVDNSLYKDINCRTGDFVTVKTVANTVAAAAGCLTESEDSEVIDNDEDDSGETLSGVASQVIQKSLSLGL